MTRDEIRFFVAGVTAGTLPDYQASALLMAILLRGMTAEETAWLTDAMVHSGARVDLGDIPGLKVDKHSTGGVGDKTSLILAPLAAACGVPVPMMSGRGLGHTGGTLDKLEAIPGFRVNLSLEEMKQALARVGCAMIGQTAQIAPADKKLYALRDVTGTVESIPLISASIMSKKIAEGIDALVLDVKTGSGAFMKTEADSRRLAESLVSIGNASGVKTEAIITAMDSPLGPRRRQRPRSDRVHRRAEGRRPADLIDVSVELTARMLVLGRVAADHAEAEQKVRAGDRRRAPGSSASVRSSRRRAATRMSSTITAGCRTSPTGTSSPQTAPAIVARVDAELVGRASVALGAGRDRVEDPVDPAVGMMVRREAGRRRPRRRSAARTALSRSRAARRGAAARGPGRHDRRRTAGGAPSDRGRGALMFGILQPLFGAAVILAIATAFSTNRRAINWTTVAWGLGLQVLFALIVLKTTAGQVVFTTLGTYITKMLGFAGVGAAFVFGPLGDAGVWGDAMQRVFGPDGAQYAVIFAFQVLPTIIFIAALFAILYYFGIMQIVVRIFAVLMHRVMKVSGAESLNVAASIFMGQTEAPLTIRPYLPEMTQSELMTVMTSGMAHISGGIMAAYILFGIEAKHLLTAVIMTAPGTIMMAKMLVPETEVPKTMGTVRLEVERTDVNVIDAAGRGTGEGLAPRAERRRDAHLLSGDHRARQRGPAPHPVQRRVHEPRTDLRLGVRARRVGDGGAVEGRAADRQPARHADGAQRVRRLLAGSAR